LIVDVLFGLIVGPREGQSKKKGMPVRVPSARYSLVKGERIVRSVLSTRLVEVGSEALGYYTRLNKFCLQSLWFNLYVALARQSVLGRER